MSKVKARKQKKENSFSIIGSKLLFLEITRLSPPSPPLAHHHHFYNEELSLDQCLPNLAYH